MGDVVLCQRITSDAEYYKAYPTIYHLRNEMATSPNKKYDPKLIYLAIHSIFKSRGNFLYEDLSAAKDVDGPLTQVVDTAKIFYGVEEDSSEAQLPEWLSVLDSHKDDFKEILLDSKTYKSKKDKQTAIKNKISKNKTFGEFVKLILGYDVKYKSAFGSADDKNDKTSIKLSSPEVDSTITEAGEYAEFLSAAKSLYSAIEYISIMYKGRKYDENTQSESSISDIMIARYKRYQKQLTDLKIVFKAIYPNKAGAMHPEYHKFFRDYRETNNYARYTYSKSMCDENEFKKKILDAIARNEVAILEAGYAEDGETVAEKAKKILLCLGGKPSVLSKVVLTDENFDAEYEAELGYLQRPRMAGNGVFPNQLHEEELNKILDNQAKHYPQLQERRDDIIKIFNFKIDYFVGPLGAKGEKPEGFGWLKRNPGFEDVNINALNYDDAIDKVATRTEFITRMVGHCTYLWEEPALPKNSMIYSYFNVLQELSNISVIINGAEAQKLNDLHDLDGLNYFQVIIKRLLESNTYKLKDLEHSLRRQTQYKDADIVIKGFANGEKLNSNLKPIRDMMRIFDLKINAEAYGTSDSIIEFLKSKKADVCEKIIKYITIFGESKKILIESLKEIDGLSLTEKQVNDLKALSYSGWGNLSKKLIFEFKDSFDGAEYFGKTILELMENKYKNFISVYSDERYQFEQQVKDRLKGINKPIQEQIEELACSPSVKRGIFQAFKVVQELVKVMGHAPENIFIEFARGEDKNKKGEVSKSRQKEMRKKYELAKSSAQSLYDEYMKHVDRSKLEGDKQADVKFFDSERVMLYYLQAGRCMYSKEILDLNHLSDYDVDHIVPQCLIKDDSFDNKVLVKRTANNEKGDSEVVPEEIRQNAK